MFEGNMSHFLAQVFGGILSFGWQNVVMLLIGGLLLYLAIVKDYEPLLLLPIGFGAILINLPLTGLMSDEGILRALYNAGIATELFPCLLFVGIGAMTDFGPLLSNPRILLLGGAGQFGIYMTLLLALLLGFDRLEALDVFRLLLNVSGVGPRGALSLLSVMTPRGLAAAVAEENAGLLSRAPGVGKKIAQRVILELKDKLRPLDFPAEAVSSPGGEGDGTADAIEALVALGFSGSRAAMAAGRAAREMGSGAPSPQLVRQALKYLAEGLC